MDSSRSPKPETKFGKMGSQNKLSWRDLCVWLTVAVVLGLFYQHLQRNLENLHYNLDWRRVNRFFLFWDDAGFLRLGPLLQGLISTLKLAVYSIIFALIIGVPMGILQVQKLRFLRLIGQFYVEFIRNIPPLVVVISFYFFFASPLVAWLGLESLSRNASPFFRQFLSFAFEMGENNVILGNFIAAVIIMGIYEGSYIAEIVRAGIQSLPVGQHKASYSLGLSARQNYRLVILPQMFRAQLPSFVNQFVSAIKDSSIVSLISIQELTFRSKQVITTSHAFIEVSLVLLFLYLILTGLCSFLGSRLSKYYQLK